MYLLYIYNVGTNQLKAAAVHFPHWSETLKACCWSAGKNSVETRTENG